MLDEVAFLVVVALACLSSPVTKGIYPSTTDFGNKEVMPSLV